MFEDKKLKIKILGIKRGLVRTLVTKALNSLAEEIQSENPQADKINVLLAQLKDN